MARDYRKDPKYKPANDIPFAFSVGECVVKRTGDYEFEGIVMAAYRTRNGSPRFVVENEAGIQHIFNHNQLQRF